MASTEEPGTVPNQRSWKRRDILLLAFLSLFAVQCVRSHFFNNESNGMDWSTYAAGTAKMPYQGRIGMVPVLRWAEENSFMVQTAHRYNAMMVAGARYKEPVTVEKFASLLSSLLAMFGLLGFTVWYGRRKMQGPWWLSAVILLEILTVTLAVHSEHTAWTPYDIPHTALFGLAVLCAYEGWWAAMLLLFAIDVPVRETSIFLLAVTVPMAYLRWKQPLWRTVALALGMGVYWEGWHLWIQHRFAHNGNDIGNRLRMNLHEIAVPTHWPQMLCAGGYLIVFIWLERRRLSPNERLLLYCTLLSTPVTLWFGVWGESRIWLEWSLPWAVLAAAELNQYWSHRSDEAPTREALPTSRDSASI
ncbi:hypothetical protein JAO29_06070 [Edaphobacter sp. HDX4]|uniref:hypothetical protein n=1 Tax=Edaphobacter sp. HDX4 TaxID=2794064 RepID=UPI002FE58E79